LIVLLAGFVFWQRRPLTRIVRNWSDLSEGGDEAKQLRSADDVLAFIDMHRADVSLAAWTVGDPEHGIYLNADQARPLASTVKLQLLCEYAAEVEVGTLDPKEAIKVADWERYWLPALDGHAHERTFEQLRDANKYRADGSVQLQDVVFGMMRYSDDAAADYLMARFGRARVRSLPARLGMPDQGAPLPISGAFLSWESTKTQGSADSRLARYRALGADGYADLAWSLAEQLADDPQLRAAERQRLENAGPQLTLREQMTFASALFPRGSARAYAGLMERIQAGALPGSARMRPELEWPLQNPALRERFAQLGTKGGSLAGIMTAATYAQTKANKQRRVLALFFEHLPVAVWLQLMQSFVHQEFELRLLEDDAFFARARERLAASQPSAAK
jgi:D-alanyl-D-alanine carboxypeptidase